MRTSLLPMLVAAFVSAAVAASCSSSTCEDKGTCGGPGSLEGGADGGADVVIIPAGCDLSADVKDAPKCVVSDVGVFVDGASGSES